MSYNIRDHEGNRLVHEKVNVNNVNIHYCIGGPVGGPAVLLGTNTSCGENDKQL